MSDLIDRQAALDIYDDYNVAVENGELEAYGKHRKRLLELPSAQPSATDTNVRSRATEADDLINRKDTIRAIEAEKVAHGDYTTSSYVGYEFAEEVVESMPSAQPECEDAVSRFEVLRLIDYSSHDLNDAVDNRYMQNEIKQLPSVTPKQPGWIPVTERLPEYFVPVLTWDGQNQCVEMRIPYVITTEGETIKSDWWCDDYWEDKEESLYNPQDLRDGAALAWMPLPTPYREGGQE